MRYTLRITLFIILILAFGLAAGCSGPAQDESAPPPGEEAPVAAQDTEEDAGEEMSPETSGDSTGDGLRTFVIASEESSASYIVDEEFLPEMLSKYGIAAGREDTVGTTPSVDGRLELNLDDLSAPLGDNQFRVDLSLLESDQSLRDEWLQTRGPQFSQYPTAQFLATGVQNAPNSYADGEQVEFQLLGDLTIRDITQSAVFDVAATLEGERLAGVATADLRMSDFGVDPPDFANTLRVSDEFQVRIDFVAVEE